MIKNTVKQCSDILKLILNLRVKAKNSGELCEFQVVSLDFMIKTAQMMHLKTTMNDKKRLGITRKSVSND